MSKDLLSEENDWTETSSEPSYSLKPKEKILNKSNKSLFWNKKAIRTLLIIRKQSGSHLEIYRLEIQRIIKPDIQISYPVSSLFFARNDVNVPEISYTGRPP